ncbi:PREDICTED: uncharacterized protein LOC108371828 [Rhagoletis zephyria]|uniref:uncharacterized protein LOC108371828 n=1 Tax=Rhagoletis zephyria TaxID=28612 RepID=UPI00081129FA|nr:PREDICTED: uncharacterized protein LOC108371828 [Rhagoletis zephyria]
MKNNFLQINRSCQAAGASRHLSPRVPPSLLVASTDISALEYKHMCICTMCWCLRVYWTVLHNLFARFVTNVANSVYNNNLCRCCSSCSHSVRCHCCDHCLIHRNTQRASSELSENECEEKELTARSEIEVHSRATTTCSAHHYVIVDDIDANYLEIERRKIETESFYRLVDRATAEDILNCREDGSCLVRPFKEMDPSIKYIVTIYAQQQYFHLFIRQINGKDLYGIGQQKSKEKVFSSPSDIIDFYSYNPLQCTNKSTSISLVLKPIIT